MHKQVFGNMNVIVLSDTNMCLESGKLTNANVILKDTEHFIVIPQDVKPWKHAAHNPLIYEGRFFSSRQKQNGNISLHGVISGKTNISDAYKQARQELDEFFKRLEAII